MISNSSLLLFGKIMFFFKARIWYCVCCLWCLMWCCLWSTCTLVYVGIVFLYMRCLLLGARVCFFHILWLFCCLVRGVVVFTLCFRLEHGLGLWWGVVSMFCCFEFLLGYPLGHVWSGPHVVWSLLSLLVFWSPWWVVDSSLCRWLAIFPRCHSRSNRGEFSTRWCV